MKTPVQFNDGTDDEVPIWHSQTPALAILPPGQAADLLAELKRLRARTAFLEKENETIRRVLTLAQINIEHQCRHAIIIRDFVAEEFGITPAQIVAMTHRHKIAWPRQIAAYLIKKHTYVTVKAANEILGYNGNGSYICAAERVIEALAVEPATARILAALELRIAAALKSESESGSGVPPLNPSFPSLPSVKESGS